MWFTVRRENSDHFTATVLPPSPSLSQEGNMTTGWCGMEPAAVFRTHTSFSNKASQKGQMFSPKHPCDFIIFSSTKWFISLRNKAPSFNVSQWNVNAYSLLFWGRIFKNVYNIDISGNKCRKRCLKDVNKYPKSETDLFHKVTVTEMIVFKGYLHR